MSIRKYVGGMYLYWRVRTWTVSHTVLSTFVLVIFYWYICIGTFLLVHFYWYICIGTFLLIHLYYISIGTFLLVHFYWYISIGRFVLVFQDYIRIKPTGLSCKHTILSLSLSCVHAF